MNSVINVKGLKKTFKTKLKTEGLTGSVKSIIKPNFIDVEAIKDISFSVDRAEMLAFLGPNGAGKSTSIKILTGILHPTSGVVNVLDLKPNKNRKELAFKIGCVFGQKSQLWFHLPPIDSFKLLGAIYEMDKKTLDKRVAELIEMFDIGEIINIPVRKLSLGQRMRCEFAASIIHKPELLFLDEPTIGLDVIVKQKIRELILKINQEDHVTVFLTSHDAGDVELLCKRALIINHGKIVLDSSIKNLKYGYMNKKIIDVKFNEIIDMSFLQGIKIIKNNKNALKIQVDTKNEDIHNVMLQVMNAGNIADVTISDVPMDEIIADIYKTRGEINGCE